MNHIIAAIYNENNIEFILALLKKYEKENTSIEEITVDLLLLGSELGEELIIYAKEPIKIKVAKALNLLREKNKQAFLEAKKRGLLNGILNKMSVKEKCNLLTELGINFKKTLSKDEQKIFEIISDSIDETLEKEAKQYGFNSYEELLKYKSVLEDYEIAYTFAKLTLTKS